jgi:hypothetical protein
MNEKMIRQGAFTSIYAFNGNTSSPLDAPFCITQLVRTNKSKHGYAQRIFCYLGALIDFYCAKLGAD